MASRCISKHARSRPPRASLGPLVIDFQVHHQTSSIPDSQCISKLSRSRPASVALNPLDLSLLVHQQKLNLLQWIYLVYWTHKLIKMKSRFPWNMALLECSRVFFGLPRCCFQASRPVYPRLRMWQSALDERFTLPLEISQIISQHTLTSPNSISPRDDDSIHSIHLMKSVVLVFKDPHGSIWPMIVTMQKWFTIFKLLKWDRQ